MSYTTRGVSSDIQTPRSELKNEAIAEFLINFEVFRYLMKHDFRVYDISRKNPYLKRKSGLNLTKFYGN